jgi:hypothetical protein
LEEIAAIVHTQQAFVFTSAPGGFWSLDEVASNVQRIDATMSLRKSMFAVTSTLDSLVTVATTAGGAEWQLTTLYTWNEFCFCAETLGGAASKPITLDALGELIVYGDTAAIGDAEADQRESEAHREAVTVKECREFVGIMFPDAEPDSVLIAWPTRSLGVDSLILLRRHFSAFGAVRIALEPKLSESAQQRCATIIMHQKLNEDVEMPRTQAINGVQLEVRVL